MSRIPTLLSLLSLSLAAPLAAQQEPVYPEGAEIPRSLTPLERAWIAKNPLGGSRAVTPAPTGPLHCASEYEPMEAILMAWEGSGSWTTILAQMAAEITTTGDADVYIVCDTQSEANSATTKVQNNGANMSRVFFPVKTTDTIWIRDYGPRYVYQGDCRVIIDHTYNRPRPQDNRYPSFFAGYRGHGLYEHPLTHGGGNYHLDSNRNSFTTRLINNENPGYTEQQIFDVFLDYQNVETMFFDPLPASVDSTQHIDMWMQVLSDTDVMISDWPAQSGSTQDQICDQAAIDMAAAGYTVHRIPARKVGGTFGTHYTYTNVVMCNDLVLIPSYTNSTITQYNSQALSAWQAACPNKTIVQINAQSIVTSAGVLHCIVMHMPEHRGGVNPTAYLIGPNGGQILDAGTQVELEWITDDDVSVSSVDLQLSLDGGATWPTTIASNQPAIGSYTWTVPNAPSNAARLRVVARDGANNTGDDESDGLFAIASNGNDAAWVTYGDGKSGTLGVPALLAGANPVLGSSGQLVLSGALPNSTAKLLRGPASAAIAYDQGIVHVAHTHVFDVAVDGAGNGSLTASVPNLAALAGKSFYWQVLVPNDPAAAGMGWSMSNGLETRLGY